MIEKPKTVYQLGGDTVRLLDPVHFHQERSSEEKGRKHVGTKLTGDLRQYIRAHPDKVEVN